MSKTMKVIIFSAALLVAHMGFADVVYDQNFDDNNTW
jgi:hypothetical protein